MNFENHQNTEGTPPETPDSRANCHRSPGPRTPEGKAISSQNATTHGCRSKTLILRHEDPAEYEALHKKWWDEYQPSGHIEETLVQQLIDNHWFLKRASLRLEQVEWEMPMNAKHWIESYQKEVGLFTRYKTAAERAFYKSFHEVERYLRDCVRDENAAHKADLLRLRIEAQIANKPAEAKQIALKMAIPLYRDRRDRAAARAKMQTPGPQIGPVAPSPPVALPDF
jgi:predicted metal-dependent hydrolase